MTDVTQNAKMISLRMFWMDLAPSNSVGKKDLCQELRVKFVGFAK